MWLTGWKYRRPITIDNSTNTNALTDYQVLITLDTASLIAAGKMRSDGGDIRFTDSDGVTLLNYWIESGVNTTSTKIWVKVPSIPANSNKTIYVYYGNQSATSQSNGASVFIQFFDFEDGLVPGNWGNFYGTAPFISTESPFEGIRHIKKSDEAGVVSGLGALYSSGIVEAYIRLTSALTSNAYLGSGTGGTWGSTIGYASGIPYQTSYLKGIMKWSGGSASFIYNGVTYNFTYTGTPGQVMFPYFGGTNSLNIDLWFFRKYTSPEPTTSVGVEESLRKRSSAIPILMQM